MSTVSVCGILINDLEDSPFFVFPFFRYISKDYVKHLGVGLNLAVVFVPQKGAHLVLTQFDINGEILFGERNQRMVAFPNSSAVKLTLGAHVRPQGATRWPVISLELTLVSCDL